MIGDVSRFRIRVPTVTRVTASCWDANPRKKCVKRILCNYREVIESIRARDFPYMVNYLPSLPLIQPSDLGVT